MYLPLKSPRRRMELALVVIVAGVAVVAAAYVIWLFKAKFKPKAQVRG